MPPEVLRRASRSQLDCCEMQGPFHRRVLGLPEEPTSSGRQQAPSTSGQLSRCVHSCGFLSFCHYQWFKPLHMHAFCLLVASSCQDAHPYRQWPFLGDKGEGSPAKTAQQSHLVCEHEGVIAEEAKDHQQQQQQQQQMQQQKESKGAFVRRESQHRNWIRADGSSQYKPEKGRYHLYVANNCPWCHRLAATLVSVCSFSSVSFIVQSPGICDLKEQYTPPVHLMHDSSHNSVAQHEYRCIGQPPNMSNTSSGVITCTFCSLPSVHCIVAQGVVR